MFITEIRTRYRTRGGLPGNDSEKLTYASLKDKNYILEIVTTQLAAFDLANMREDLPLSV